MTQPAQADLNAPPGGGTGATVVAATAPVTPPATPQDPPSDPLKLEPSTPATPAAPPASPPAPSAPEALPDYGDPGLNVAADYFVNTLGLSMDSPEIVEAAKGNYSYLEAKIAQLGDKAKGADRFITLAKEAQSRVGDQQKAAREAAVKTVYEAVGGEENWKAVQNFARTNLQGDQLAEANTVLEQGGMAAKAMATYLMSLATSHPQTTIQGKTAAEPAATATQPILAGGPLNREQYRAEYKKLVEQYGITGAQKRPELQALNARRSF